MPRVIAFFSFSTMAPRPPRLARMRHMLLQLSAVLPACLAENAPFAPIGTPGRLPNEMPSSLDNDRSNSSKAPLLNITALIIASSLKNFERAAAEVRKSDIRSTVWVPAVFLEEKNYSLCGGGGNGLRHAMRNAWNLIASSGVGMVVMEEDVAYAAEGKNSSVSEYVLTKCLRSTKRCDLAYLGHWNSFFTTHAIYIPPHTAGWLMELTANTCYPRGAQIDQPMHARCLHRPNRPHWNCVAPPSFTKPKTFGVGFFVQDPVAVPPVLHGGGSRSSNRVIARRTMRRRRA